jgi:hypothetical protein
MGPMGCVRPIAVATSLGGVFPATHAVGNVKSRKTVCCDFCNGLFLKAGWRWIDSKRRHHTSNIEPRTSPYAQSNQKVVQQIGSAE